MRATKDTEVYKKHATFGEVKMSEYTELIEQFAKKDAEIEKLKHENQQYRENMHNLIDKHKKHIAVLEKDRDAWKKRANCNIAFVAKESNLPEVE